MTSLEALRCPSCSASLRSDDLDETRGIAKCSHCRTLLNLPSKAAPAAGFAPRPAVPLPPRIEVEEWAGGLEIRRRWFTPMFLFLVVFCIAWDAFLLFWYFGPFGDGAPWIMKVFPIVHVAVGVGLTYFTLAGLVNTTTIRIAGGRFSVAHGPLPWPGNRDIDRDEVEQLYCKERVHRSKDGTHSSFELWMAQKGGASAKLVGACNDADQALYLEQRLEQTLAIKDRPVSGELPR